MLRVADSLSRLALDPYPDGSFRLRSPPRWSNIQKSGANEGLLDPLPPAVEFIGLAWRQRDQFSDTSLPEQMRNILTADQFVAGIISVLALRGRKHFVLKDTELDDRFEQAFETLIANEESLGVVPNFTFFIDPLHGDSVSLRETLLAAKEKELIALNNPTFHTFDIRLSDQRANRYLESLPLPRSFLDEVVNRCFST